MLDVSVMIDFDRDGNPVAHEIVTYAQAKTFVATPAQYYNFIATYAGNYHSTWAKGDGSRSLYKMAVEAEAPPAEGDQLAEDWATYAAEVSLV